MSSSIFTMATKTSDSTPKGGTTHPFYNPVIRTALLQLAQQNSSSQTSCGILTSNHVVDSSDEESTASSIDNNSDSSDDSEDSVDEDNVDPLPLEQLVQLSMDSSIAAKKSAHTTKKKKTHKVITSKAPCITLPLLSSNGSQTEPLRLTLSIPTILLPNKYLRNNPSHDPSEISSHLISTHSSFTQSNILIVLLQSGRFASAIYKYKQNPHNPNGYMECIAHQTSTRYTVRKGQGGSQSVHDSKSRAKSMGAQLRREGEKQLRHDVVSTWIKWKHVGYLQDCCGVWVSVPKSMRKDYLFGGDDGDASNVNSAALIEKHDKRLRNIPLDSGRPTLEAVDAVLECLLRCEIGEICEDAESGVNGDNNINEPHDDIEFKSNTGCSNANQKKIEQQLPKVLPYTELHNAVIAGDLVKVTELLRLLEQSEDQNAEQFYDINTQGGPEFQSPLHLAASSTHENASAIINVLMIQGRANPSAIDSRGRPPYYLASSDKIRETFRLCRGKLGEDHCCWDASKIGSALTSDDIELKRIKALEKKKRQRARQKEKKAAEAEAAAIAKREEIEKAAKLKEDEDAKRIRDGLKPKIGTGNACDYCLKLVKKKNDMFQRLQYAYCSTDCVKRHQRELAAAAATARLGK